MFECLLKAKKKIATKEREREIVNRQLDRWKGGCGRERES
jgi:hypothetical protein